MFDWVIESVSERRWAAAAAATEATETGRGECHRVVRESNRYISRTDIEIGRNVVVEECNAFKALISGSSRKRTETQIERKGGCVGNKC